MSAWLDDDPFRWWEGVWMVLAFPVVVVGDVFAREFFWARPMVVAGVVGVALMVARVRNAWHRVGIR